ncbi:beta-alanine transporter [Spodoptera frugiperda]|uniref:Beta-alanine transporter n=1 Tax=Spodoptera frugiperda TaxID=7108 RepID=A0A9R0ER81_SPOFR|nr:beta-alanine transporter [Spodoptera frugiperda]
MTWTKELDEAAVLATKTGHWHVVLFYLLCGLAAIPTSFLVFSQVFTNATPEHWCAPPPELDHLGLPDQLLRSLTIPGEQGTYESCTAYDIDRKELREALGDFIVERTVTTKEGNAFHTLQIYQLVSVSDERQKELISNVTSAVLSVRRNTTSPCANGWRFSTEQYQDTLVTDFSLVCDMDWLPRMCNTLFWVGSIFGNLFFGWMSDRYGRRPTILLMVFLEVPLAIASSFATSFWTYVGLRVAGGLFFPALYQLPFILALELMPPGQRNHTGIVVGMLFASGMCLLSLLAYAVQDWYHLSLVTTLPFILLYGYYWLIPESPRWLVGRGRIADAEKVLRNLARKNGIILERGFLLELHKKIKEEEEEMQEELATMSNMNGHIAGYTEVPEKDEALDRRISNMLTFKPDLTRISETDEANKSNLEKIIALEVAEIVNKKSRLKREEKEEDKDPNATETTNLNADHQQKATQTEFTKSPASTLRRKSIQLVSKIFIQGDVEDVIENKRMDDQNSEGDCKASPLDVFRYPNIRKKFFILTFDWVALGVVYNSMSYNTPNLGVNDYLAFFIGGAVEIPSYFIAWRCMERFGRRWVLCIFMCVGGVACISCVLVPESWPWITVSLSMLGRLFAASSFAVFYVLIGELLPTVLRAQAMGAASFISGLGLLACPYIVHLAVYSRALPLTIMGVLSVMGGVTSLFLPETLNQPLPQTLGDGETFGRDFKIFSCVERPREK